MTADTEVPAMSKKEQAFALNITLLISNNFLFQATVEGHVSTWCKRIYITVHFFCSDND
jgi:hypothetical protein